MSYGYMSHGLTMTLRNSHLEQDNIDDFIMILGIKQ